MKKVLLAVVGIMFAATSFAQNAMVASLSHEGAVTYYYGVNAFKQAVTAAASGDIINLSGGTFDATQTTISAGITLRGAGIDSDNPTYLIKNTSSGDLYIDIPSSDANQFIMEGIRCQITVKLTGTYSNPYFVKCQFVKLINEKSDDAVTNIMIANCKITGDYHMGGTCSTNFVNSYVALGASYDSSTITAINCVISREYNFEDFHRGEFTNCIFYNTYTSYNNCNPLSVDNKTTNCVGVSVSRDIFENVQSRTNCPSTQYKAEDVFENYTGTYSDDQTFELTSAFKTAFKGTDGLEIGLYGGLQPYNSTPSYPLISTMNVDKQTATDGKLGVTIEVSK